MLEGILKRILALVLGEIATFIMAFITQLQRHRADDPTLWNVIEGICRKFDTDHPDWPGETKYDYAWREIRAYLSEAGRDLSDSLTNSIIEMVVQKRNWLEGK